MRPGSRWLWLACLLAFPLTFSPPAQRLERSLYDSQLRVARALQGKQTLDERIALLALDDRAMREGLDDKVLDQTLREFAPRSGLASGVEMAPFFQPDADGTLRGVTVVRQGPHGLELAPPLAHVLRFLGLPATAASWDGKTLSFGSTRLPTDAEGRIYPIFPFTEAQADNSSVLGAAGLRFLVQLVGGTNRADAVVPSSIANLDGVREQLPQTLLILGTHLKIADELELPTPSGNMVSIELYASTVDSLLRQNVLSPLSLWATGGLTLLFLALLVWLLPGKRTANAVGTWLALALIWLGLAQVLFSHGLFLRQAPALVMSGVALFVHLLRRSRRLSAALFGFGGGELGEQTAEREIVATILFTNLPVVIKEMEKSAPEQALAARNAYARCLGHVVSLHGGRLVDQQGDAQMVAFGLDDEPNHAALAVACGLDLVAAVTRLLSDELAGEGGLQVHCGIVTGTVARGQVGGGSYRSVAAIGDTTNASARLMGEAQKRGLGVLASRTTTESLGARLESRSAGEIALRGRQEPLLVDEVVSFQSPPRPLVARPHTAWPRAAVLWLTVAVLASTLCGRLLDGLLPARYALLDSLALSSGRAPVVFAGIDEASLARLPWPWPRRLHAMAIENARKAGVRCLFFDLVFDLPSASPEDDQALVQAVRANPNVVLAAVASKQSPVLIGDLIKTDQWGLINVPGDSSGTDRRIRQGLWSFAPPAGGVTMPGAPRAVARLAAPEIEPRMARDSTFFLRWGPEPRTISYYRLIDPADPIWKELSGTVIVVGDNTDSSNDAFETPIGRKKGGLIHAFTAQTMMTGEVLLDRGSSVASWALTLLASLLTTVLVVRASGPGHQVALLMAMSGGVLTVIVLVARAGWFLGASALLAVPCALLLGICLKALGLAQALARYVPQRLQDRLEAEESVPDRQVWAAVLVTDIRGYTTLSEHRSPLEILSLLNRYHETTARCYESFGGQLLTYQGDAQIVVFGGLESLASPVMAAVKAAQRLPEMVERVCRESSLEPGALSVGAGVASGEMTLALIQAADQLQYTVLGEPVRRAHSLQSLSDELGSSLLLDANSAREVRDLLELQRHVARNGLEAFTLGE